MRDLVFKSMTSEDRKKRAISSSEVVDKQGTHSVIHRHFVYLVKELTQGNDSYACASPYLYILREHSNKEQKERFFCKVKGSICVSDDNKSYVVFFTHSLKIDLTPALAA